MRINKKLYYGIDQAEIDHLIKNMIPYWEKDENLINATATGHAILFERAKLLLETKFNTEIWIDESNPRCHKFNTYLLTKPALEVCEKIKLTDSVLNNLEFKDAFGHIQMENQFIRFGISGGLITVARLYIGENRYVHYSVYQLLPKQYFDQVKEAHENPKLNITKENVVEHLEILRILIYLFYSELEIIEIKPNQKIGTKANGYKNDTSTHIKIVKSNWNKILLRTEKFSVSGHLRLQPCGVGRTDRKLIWIDGFEKKGYTVNVNKDHI